MQRLFTTFADGWPGFALLVQRLVVGVALLRETTVLLKGTATAGVIIPQAFAAMLAIFLLLGLWSPVAGVLIAAVEIWVALTYPGGSALAILLAAFSITLAMIGPGAFSIDARLFGRKHIGG
ncbi:MAG TPA: hypothetical protein VMX38_05005 [Verrucomicrobiae bacterium]|nr:hypothetical protein [Verrucomicrobiae bacterium]